MKLPHFLLLCACAAATGLVLAQGHGRAGREERGNGNDRGGFGQQQDFSRERPDRQRYERFEPPQRDPRDQMSAEERRQLRRDVNDAGREIYRRPDRF
jgi:hypothetical protein